MTEKISLYKSVFYKKKPYYYKPSPRDEKIAIDNRVLRNIEREQYFKDREILEELNSKEVRKVKQKNNCVSIQVQETFSSMRASKSNLADKDVRSNSKMSQPK